MPPELHMDPSQLDLSRVLAGRPEIERVNPQRFEMEQLTAIVYMDTEQNLIAGYKEVTADEFWVRCHMPEYPLMPGVLMCEAAAQLCSYYSMVNGLLQGDFLGFGGMDQHAAAGSRACKPLDRGSQGRSARQEPDCRRRPRRHARCRRIFRGRAP